MLRGMVIVVDVKPSILPRRIIIDARPSYTIKDFTKEEEK
jgi:hypothetical protein